jgi:hypothetical protein
VLLLPKYPLEISKPFPSCGYWQWTVEKANLREVLIPGWVGFPRIFVIWELDQIFS